jgi:hypothetical protein
MKYIGKYFSAEKLLTYYCTVIVHMRPQSNNMAIIQPFLKNAKIISFTPQQSNFF